MNVEGLLPGETREGVRIAPAGAWVALREDEVDPSALTMDGTNPVFLIDRQYHVTHRESYQRFVYRLDTMQAVHEAAQWRTSFDPGVDQLTIHSLSVWRDGVRRENARPEAIRLLQREAGLDHFVIDGQVTAVVPLEDVRMGDLIDTSFTLQTKSRLLPENYWLFATVPSAIPLHRFRLELRFPSSRAMRWKSSVATFAPAITEGPEETIWTWALEKPPREEPEVGVPSWHLTDRWIQVTDLASWGEVVTGVLAAWTEQFDHSEVQRVAAEIAAAHATPEDRAAGVLNFVQDEIRYLSMETGVGGQIPSAPATVLRRRFGDCKDKAFLAAHLFRCLGIPARPILVSTVLRQTIGELLPMPDAFNHAVVEYAIGNRRRWVDTTISQQGGGALSRPTPSFRLGLPVAPGVTELENLPTPPATRDLYELHETFFLDTSGRSSTLRVVLTTTGQAAEYQRRIFVHHGVEAVSRQREQSYQNIFPELKRVGKLEWHDDREHNELVISETYDGRCPLLPGPSTDIGIFAVPMSLIRSLLSFPESAKRRQPFALSYPCNVEHHLQIESPAIQRGQNTGNRNHGAPFQFSYNITQLPGSFGIKYSLRTTADSVPPDKFENFKEKVREIWGWTMFSFPLRLGVSVPWGSRQGANIVSRRRASPGERHDQRAAEPTTPAGAAEFSLPEIAPPLVSIVKAPAEVREEGPTRPRRSLSEEHDAPPRATLLPPVSVRLAPRDVQIPRRRRRSRKTNQRQLWIAAAILFALVGALVGIYFVFR